MKKSQMIPCITYNQNAEEFLIFYQSIFPSLEILNKKNLPQSIGGDFLSADICVGQGLMVLNGGANFSFSPDFSLFVHCNSQDEVDLYWDKFSANSGKEINCGWITDHFDCWQLSIQCLRTRKRTTCSKRHVTNKKIDLPTIKNAFYGN